MSRILGETEVENPPNGLKTAVLDVSSGHSMNNGLESAGTLTTNWENNGWSLVTVATSGNHLFRRSTRTSMTAWMNYTICIQQLYNIYHWIVTIRRPPGVSNWKVLFLFCSWLVHVPLFSCHAFLLRLNATHPPAPPSSSMCIYSIQYTSVYSIQVLA